MKLHLKQSRGNNSESMKARVAIFCTWHIVMTCSTLLWSIMIIFKGYSSYRADTKMHKKHQMGDNLKIIKARALIFARGTSSWPVLHDCEVSSKYSKRFSSYRADTKMFTDRRTDARHIAISKEPFGRSLKIKAANIVDPIRRRRIECGTW